MTALTLDRMKTFFVKRFKLNKKFWARVEEPDTLVRGVEVSVYGLILTAALAVLAWYILSERVVTDVATFLVSFNVPNFAQIYSAFGVALVILTNMLVTLIIVLFGTADNADVIEMISDLDSNTQERLTEINNQISERLDRIERNA